MNKLKTLSAIFCLMLAFTNLKAQDYPLPLIMEGKVTDPQYGLPTNMVYQTILETNLKQKEFIKKIGSALVQNHFVEEKDLKIDQITNSQKQFIVKGGFKSGMFAGKGKTSLAKRLKSPVNLYFDIIFDFDETGKAKIQFTNFSEESFVRVNDEGQFHTEGSMFKMLTPTNGVSDERHTKIKELEANVMKLNTGFGKAMSFIEKGKANVRITVGANGSSVVSNNGIKDDLANLYTDITTEWKILDKAVEDKIAVWVDPAESGYINMYPTLVKKQIAQKEDAEKRLAEKNVLLFVDNDRFDRYYKDLFNQVFLMCAIEVNAKILGIQKDNDLLYTVDEQYNLVEEKKQK